MKKLIALMLIAVMLMPIVVYCCDGSGAVLPAVEAETSLSGEVWVAVQANTGFLYGMLAPDEKVAVAPMQTAVNRVRGITAQGVNRAKGEARYMLTDDECVLGMSKMCASVTIGTKYMETVMAIAQRQIGEGAEITASTIVACTIRRTGCTVTHMMAGRKADKVAVGSVLFSGAEMAATLYVTDWDGDGLLDLAFSVNPGPATTVEPKPTNTAKPGKPSKPVVTQKPGCNKKCIEININIEKLMVNHLNIDSIFKPCNKSVEGC